MARMTKTQLKAELLRLTEMVSAERKRHRLEYNHGSSPFPGYTSMPSYSGLSSIGLSSSPSNLVTRIG